MWKFNTKPDDDPDLAIAMFLMQRAARTMTGKRIINELRYGREPDPDDLTHEEEMRPGSTM